MKISIITINFNNREGLRATIESVIAQNCREMEHIVIDGGSTDGSVEVIRQYEEHLTYWISEPDKGVYNAMNKGIAAASGAYCNFLNSGDTFQHPDVIGGVIAQRPQEDILEGDTIEVLEGRERLWKAPEEVSMRLFYKGALAHQSAFIRTSLMRELGYDEKYRIASDWKFFIEALILKNATYRKLGIVVAQYADGGISRDEKKSAAERAAILEELFSPRLIRDFGYLQYGYTDWEKLCKKVDPNSKVGKIAAFVVRMLIGLRR